MNKINLLWSDITNQIIGKGIQSPENEGCMFETCPNYVIDAVDKSILHSDHIYRSLTLD
jgi:hypothetical protein